jgi:hypothetical protein
MQLLYLSSASSQLESRHYSAGSKGLVIKPTRDSNRHRRVGYKSAIVHGGSHMCLGRESSLSKDQVETETARGAKYYFICMNLQEQSLESLEIRTKELEREVCLTKLQRVPHENVIRSTLLTAS